MFFPKKKKLFDSKGVKRCLLLVTTVNTFKSYIIPKVSPVKHFVKFTIESKFQTSILKVCLITSKGRFINYGDFQKTKYIPFVCGGVVHTIFV